MLFSNIQVRKVLIRKYPLLLEGFSFGTHGIPFAESPVLARPQEVLLSLEVWLFI